MFDEIYSRKNTGSYKWDTIVPDGVIERGDDETAGAAGTQTGIPVIQHGVDHGGGEGVGLAFVFAERDHGFPKRTYMTQPIAGGTHSNAAVLQPGNGGPREIIVVAHGIGHDNFRASDQGRFHKITFTFRNWRIIM